MDISQYLFIWKYNSKMYIIWHEITKVGTISSIFNCQQQKLSFLNFFSGSWHTINILFYFLKAVLAKIFKYNRHLILLDNLSFSR